jgi:hypothetical protein
LHNRHGNEWCPLDINPGMCIKKYCHNWHHFQVFWKKRSRRQIWMSEMIAWNLSMYQLPLV